MTTETAFPWRAASFARSAGILGSLLLLWFTAMAAMTLLPGASTAVTVVFPSKRLMNALPEGIYVLEWNSVTARIISKKPAFVLELYRAGALLVLPDRSSSCLALRRPPAI